MSPYIYIYIYMGHLRLPQAYHSSSPLSRFLCLIASSITFYFDFRLSDYMGHRVFDIMLMWVMALNLCFLCFFPSEVLALQQNYYAKTCPNVESIVRGVVTQKFKETFVTVPGTLRLFFHDCFVQGCDASVIIASTSSNTAEKDNPINLSLAGDGFDTVIKAKAAVDKTSGCTNMVSCADILAMAARDVVALAGGPSYAVELGRLDGLSSTSASVNGKLPLSTFNLDQLNSLFSSHGLSQQDMIALSAAHTVGFSHCNQFANRIYNYSAKVQVDPTINKTYVGDLQSMCPKKVDPRIAINMDPITPRKFDNVYYQNLQQGKGLFSSDQILYTDSRSKSTVDLWASNSATFEKAFIAAMTKLGRVGVKTGSQGNIRRDCSIFNS
ncbi:peroxidase 51-like [Macadamia integrifolia]|uniref:peroxidase 51-like n=1 Tax=Macadamia integrifolia TaxID=60698 RepID=UPI001C4E4EE5|nr:peroxidase 51-like [Macadamia integrifolia]